MYMPQILIVLRIQLASYLSDVLVDSLVVEDTNSYPFVSTPTSLPHKATISHFMVADFRWYYDFP